MTKHETEIKNLSIETTFDAGSATSLMDVAFEASNGFGTPQSFQTF